MEKIQFDSGIREFRINGGGVLRFNPSDPNLYGRFLEAAEKIRQAEQSLAHQAAQCGSDGQAAVKLLQEADRQMKQILSWTFGGENDFSVLLGDINLLAMGSNGQRVVTNLFQALQPVLLAGAQNCIQEETAAAVSRAQRRRAEK